MTRTGLVALSFAPLLLAACAPFQPDVALRPTPYRATTPFVVAGGVAYRRDLDDGRLSTDADVHDPSLHTDPAELAQTPALVAQCLATALVRAPAAHALLPAGTEAPGAFGLSLVLTLAEPGWMRGRSVDVGAAVDAPGTSAAGGGEVRQGTSGSGGHAAAILELRAPGGAVVDRVRIFAQRQPAMGEALDARADALCEILVGEVHHYLDWRIAGNG